MLLSYDLTTRSFTNLVIVDSDLWVEDKCGLQHSALGWGQFLDGGRTALVRVWGIAWPGV